jgi:hypothetical protein
MLGYNRRLERLENYWIADHATDPMLILLVDMYEHAHQMDLEATAAQSIDAFFSNIGWQIV